MDRPLVRINIGSAEEIASLYDVSARLAQRIVEYREAYGPFQGPDDLARVEGISPRLAVTLAPHIDWQMPAEPLPPKERDWFSALWTGLSGFAFFYLSVRNWLPDLNSALLDYQEGWVWGWVEVWISGFLLVSAIFSGLYLLCMTANFLIRSPLVARRFSRAGLFFAIMALVFWTLLGVGHAINYQFYSPNRWDDLLTNYRHLAGLVGFFTSVLVIWPQFVALLRPSAAYNPALARAFDIGILLGGPLQGVLIWVMFDKFPLWLLIFYGIQGIFLTYAGFSTIRTGKSFFQQYVEILDPLALSRQVLQTTSWMTWLNSRLPDPEQQKALKQALDRQYRPSRARTIAGVIVLGAGGWVLLTVIGGIVQWAVGKGLDQLLPLLR